MSKRRISVNSLRPLLAPLSPPFNLLGETLNMYDEIKSQVLSHFQELSLRMVELEAEGYLTMNIRRGPFVVNARKGHFPVDQCYFAMSEIEFWKHASERATRGPD